MGIKVQFSGTNKFRVDGSGAVYIRGEDGATFYPSVSENGILSWTNDKSLENPDSVSVVGPKGDKGDTGATGATGTSVTVKSVSESTADGGSNVVTFSDGKTVTIKNGSKGSTGDKGDKGDTGATGIQGPKGETGATGATGATGPKGADGKTPVKGTDYFTAADKAEMVEEVKASMDGIPSYWQTALDDGVEAINTALCEAGRNKSAFLFYSDAHWNENSQMSPVLLKYLYKNTGMTKTFYGGDIVATESTNYDTMKYLWERRTLLKDLPNHHSVVGNHDDGNATNNLFSEQYVYGCIIAPEETPDMVMGDGLYYYIDSPTEKTRYLCLDTAYKGVDSEQKAFIADALKSTPDNWHIVVVAHIWYQPDYSQYSVKPIPIIGLDNNSTTVCTILDNYNSRSGEFADCGAKVEFCIGGHAHRDYVGESSGGIPIIIVETDSKQVRGEFTCTTGTTTESSVNGVVADYDNDTLNVIRVGRGNSFAVDLSTGGYEPTYTNILDTVGWVEGVRLSGGDGGERENKNSDGTAKTDTSGFIPMTSGQYLYLKNVAWHLNDSGYGGFVSIFKADKTLKTGFQLTDTHRNESVYDMEVDENGYITRIKLDFSDMAFVRIVALNIDENSIITINEPIN